jgi:hypothetical protein
MAPRASAGGAKVLLLFAAQYGGAAPQPVGRMPDDAAET